MEAGRNTALVVGAGVSGLACARALRAGGVDVSVLDRGRRPGGRLGERSVPVAGGGEHLVDTGAAYFTVDGDPRDLGSEDASPQPGTFAEVVHGWARRGLVRPWTDTFHLAGPDGLRGTKTGPLRWAAPGGLRSLADDLAADLAGVGGTVTGSVAVEAVSLGADGAQMQVRERGEEAASTRSAGAAVLAMPDPQAARLVRAGLDAASGSGDGAGGAAPGLSDLSAALRDPWDPVVTVWARWDRRWWPADLDAAFVADHEVLSLVVDDGRRRGDGEPVLVAHTTAAFAADHLDDPSGAVEPVLAALAAVLGGPGSAGSVPEPVTAGAMRWTFSAPRGSHDEPFGLVGADGSSGTGVLAVCGDSWGGRSKVERAWTSGHDLGVALAGRLTTA